MGPSSTRLHIIKLQKTDPEGKRLLDAGITNNLKPSYKIQLVGAMAVLRRCLLSCFAGKVRGSRRSHSQYLANTGHGSKISACARAPC